MNLASLANSNGGKKDKIVDKTSLKISQTESMKSDNGCINDTCACNWKPTKEAENDKRDQGLDSVWRGT